MKWLRSSFLQLPYLAVLLLLVVIGCTSKEEPSEVLPVCGNHSCGELVMVTTDTSSDGFHYLNPSLSPDGSRILFTADWYALPSNPRYDGEDPFTLNRQIITISADRRGREPVGTLLEQGAELVRLEDIELPFGNVDTDLSGLVNEDKGDPCWVDDNTIVFWLHTIRGQRLMRGDISDLTSVVPECLLLEEDDFGASVFPWQHYSPAVSPDGEWCVFTRSGCAIPDSFETCTQLTLMCLQMSTAGVASGYRPVVFPLTEETAWIEKPRWSPDGKKIVLSASLDMGGGVGAGTEVFSINFNEAQALAFSAGEVTEYPVNNNLQQLTFTTYEEGDPITGILNTAPFYSPDQSYLYFVSTRRAPTTTLYDRNIWRIPSTGTLDPEIVFFSREDDVDPCLSSTGNKLVLSSMMGFPTEMLDRLEVEAYREAEAKFPELDEMAWREKALEDRRQLEYFQGVMSHLFVYSGF